MRMLIVVAIVPRYSKARTMSTRRSFRSCKNGLSVFFLAIGATTRLRAAGFGATLDPIKGGYFVAFRLFFHYLERSWLDLRGNEFTYVIRTTGPPRSWRWTWSISELLASFCVRQWREWSFKWLHFRPLWRKMLQGCSASWKTIFFCSLFFDKHVRDFTFCWLCLWSEIF